MAGLSSFDGYGGYYAQQIINQTPPDAAFMREFYRLLYAYYQQNGLYDYIAENLQSTRYNDRVVKPLRNPAWRVAEFYAGKLFPGVLPRDLPILTGNERIIEPIHFIWTRSNLSSMKQKWARWFAIFGDWFIKVNIDEEKTKVWLELILPEYVSDFKVDERGYLTEIRIDVPVDEDGDGEADSFYTEYWSKEEQTVSIWEHEEGLDVPIEELGNPTTTSSFADMFGDDFIPIIYQPFRDDGGGRAAGAYSAQLDKIDEVNRQATRLAQTLFRYNRALWAIETTGTDAAGRPLPTVSASSLEDTDGNVQIGDDSMLALPANSKLSTLVPKIDFESALNTLESQMSELSADLPELSYYDINQFSHGEQSGRAIRYMFDGMISRVEEARGSAEAALVKANQMALTVGQNNGVFPSVGNWIDGAMEHSFASRPVLPRDLHEEAATFALLTQGGMAVEAAAKFIGRSEIEAKAMAEVGTYFEQNIGGR